MHASASCRCAVVIAALVAPVAGCTLGESPTEPSHLSAEILVANASPVANADTAVEGKEGDSFAFSGAASLDPDGDVLTYRWDFGDGSPVASGVQVTHTYANDTVYTVTLTVSDGTDSSAATTTATVHNVEPVVTLVLGSEPAVAGREYVASGFFVDPGADRWTAEVDYGDARGFAPLQLSEKTFTLRHTYAFPNTYLIWVIVRDDDGTAIGFDWVQVVAGGVNQPPLADAGGPTVSGKEGGLVTFAGSRSSDPDRDALTYEWDFGDGMTEAGPTVQHAYGDDGEYVVRLTVSDGNLSSTATVTAQIANVEPTVTFAGAELLLGEAYSAHGSFSDPGRDAPWSATVDYGDGSGPRPLLLLADHSFALRHPYGQPGTFTVTVTVTDKDGAAGASQATVFVNALQALVGEIDDAVEALQASGALNPPTSNSLSASLDAAIAKLDAGDLDGALNSLDVFINKVDGLVKTGRLTEREAKPLLDEARRVKRIIHALSAG